MKIRTILAFTAVLTAAAVFCIVTAVSAGSAKRQRRDTCCTRLQVDVKDSADLGFVCAADVKRYIAQDYGTFTGQRPDSVGLARIEEAVKGKSAVKDCQAYVTNDGVLHVEVTQREPLVRFKDGDSGFYADIQGCLFPLNPRYTSPVLVVEGDLPVVPGPGMKGRPVKGAEWTDKVVRMSAYISSHKAWKDAFKFMHTDANGNLTLIPADGSERILFGQPEGIEEKFARLGQYYKEIRPTAERPYRSVDIRYRGQIVCRK